MNATLDLNAAVEKNMPLVKHLAGKFAVCFGPEHDDEESIQAGRIGLWKGLKSHDPSRGDLGPHLAFHVVARLKELLERRRREKAFVQAPLVRGNDGVEEDMLAQIADHRGADPDAGPDVASLLGMLCEQDRLVVRMYYLEQKSFPAIAKILGITDSSACARCHKAIARLRRHVGAGMGEGEGS